MYIYIYILMICPSQKKNLIIDGATKFNLLVLKLV